ncbi:MAG TPA: DinB family protein [Anaerolineae bacterium]|nr:DinB family protein [Anaerolineae bacterium]
MLDFTTVWSGEKSYTELVAGLGVDNLRDLTNEMITLMEKLIAECEDEDVQFVPDDPEANDTFAEDESLRDLAWTLGHVIVHVTASAEESAFLAAELARGVVREGRSRYEVPWESVTSIEQCRARLAESRRMRLASLDMWPDEPHLEIWQSIWDGQKINAVGRFVLGLGHDASHINQIKSIVEQAKVARYI